MNSAGAMAFMCLYALESASLFFWGVLKVFLFLGFLGVVRSLCGLFVFI